MLKPLLEATVDFITFKHVAYDDMKARRRSFQPADNVLREQADQIHRSDTEDPYSSAGEDGTGPPIQVTEVNAPQTVPLLPEKVITQDLETQPWKRQI
ncbi:hypothetical protein M514_10358 [Trichuris suis]|uniref:Uncharacterized protein n=1 Tax=Trichuris suis TaxID=68888 RepID=A0A085NEM6_9BILA|nr:hypothetical protein M514_10358 [Trichuris suis]